MFLKASVKLVPFVALAPGTNVTPGMPVVEAWLVVGAVRQPKNVQPVLVGAGREAAAPGFKGGTEVPVKKAALVELKMEIP